MGILEEDNVLAEGIYHTLINIQNNEPRKVRINVRVSVPASFGNDAVLTKAETIELEPYKAIQISGGKINKLLYNTSYYKFYSFRTVLILREKNNLGVSSRLHILSDKFHV